MSENPLFFFFFSFFFFLNRRTYLNVVSGLFMSAARNTASLSREKETRIRKSHQELGQGRIALGLHSHEGKLLGVGVRTDQVRRGQHGWLGRTVACSGSNQGLNVGLCWRPKKWASCSPGQESMGPKHISHHCWVSAR
ncbi:hypothetical protein BGZ63DRAFT_147490 [Mariannaea sp. PMI_226]|nr:hypothetical protein BGZ63DRAFT_147490 [Mariannaea sp. PMI_226]